MPITRDEVERLWPKSDREFSWTESWGLIMIPSERFPTLGEIVYVDHDAKRTQRFNAERNPERQEFVKKRAAEGSEYHQRALATSIMFRMLQ